MKTLNSHCKKFNALMPVIILFVMLIGCTKQAGETTPEKALNAYVKQAFEITTVEDKQKLLLLTGAEAAEDLKKMTDEQFKKEFIDNKLKLIDLKTKDLRKEDDGAVSLIYELTYQENGEKGATEHFNRKVAYLKKDQDSWKIQHTKNLKTFIEIKEGSEISGSSPSAKK